MDHSDVRDKSVFGRILGRPGLQLVLGRVNETGGTRVPSRCLYRRFPGERFSVSSIMPPILSGGDGIRSVICAYQLVAIVGGVLIFVQKKGTSR